MAFRTLVVLLTFTGNAIAFRGFDGFDGGLRGFGPFGDGQGSDEKDGQNGPAKFDWGPSFGGAGGNRLPFFGDVTGGKGYKRPNWPAGGYGQPPPSNNNGRDRSDDDQDDWRRGPKGPQKPRDGKPNKGGRKPGGKRSSSESSSSEQEGHGQGHHGHKGHGGKPKPPQKPPAPRPPKCLSINDTCSTSNDQCCGNVAGTTSKISCITPTTGPVCFCCLASVQGHPCTQNSDCCSGSCNVSRGTCNAGATGALCTANTDCSSGTCSSSAANPSISVCN